MDKDSSTTPASPISRSRLARILGLTKGTTVARIDATLPRLLQHLESRVSQANAEEVDPLRREIADLKASHASIRSKPGTISSSPENRHRAALLGTVLGTIVVFALLMVYASGVRTNRPKHDSFSSGLGAPGILLLEGALTGATLRVLDADRDEILIKTSAAGARVELAEGRYAIEVSREDCPDRWTRSVYFEEGESHRFEPEICMGSGQLMIRSNVSKDRLRIDGLDMGATTSEPLSLSVGDHEIQIDKVGYRPFVGTVRIKPNAESEILAELVPTHGSKASKLSTPPESEAAPSKAAPLPGRPIPVAKVSPSEAPASTSSPVPFDSFAFRGPIEKPNLDFESVRLLPQPLPGEKPIGPGSTRWHDRVSATLVSRYDRDASGRIDRLDESEAIPCSVWLAIERDFDEGRLGLTLVRYFGFDGSEWHPSALGFSRANRSAAFAKMKECGLRT